MINIAVCDDSVYMRKETKKCILNYSFSRELDYSLDEYDSGEKLLASDKTYDLVFMDYQFEGIGEDGITIAKKLRARGDDVTIIFLSSYPGMVFKSFEVRAFRFLVKPIVEDDFNDALDSFLQSMREEDVLKVRVDGMNCFIKANTISYVEGFGKYCIIHFIDKEEKIECHETLASVEERLSSKSFYRCYKSYVVNLKHVSSYNRVDIVLENGERLLMSRAKYKEFVEVYSDYLAGQRRYFND